MDLAEVGACGTAVERSVVPGYSGCYPRFGFASFARLGIKCEDEVPEEVFMILELKPEYFAGKTGTIQYHAAIGELEPR